MTRWLKTVWRLAIIGCLLLLTGCLQYDLDIQFDSQTHGQLQHRLHWRGAEVATNAEWVQGLQVLRDRTAAVGGTTRLLDEQTLEMTIPFNNGRELETKFNEFFASQESATPFPLLGGEPVAAQLSVHQNNWFGIIFNHINIRFDLTAVPDLTETRLPLLQGQQLLTGHVQVTAPWVRSLTGELLSSAQWALVPGEINDIEADFWVPSPIGIGAAAIALFVLIGYALKYWLRFGK